MNWRALRLTLAGMWAGFICALAFYPDGSPQLIDWVYGALGLLTAHQVYGNIADWQLIDRKQGYLDGLERIVRETFPEEPGQRFEEEPSHD